MTIGPSLLSRSVVGLASCAVGGLVTIGMLTALNHSAEAPKAEKEVRATAFEVAPPPPPKAKKKKARKQRRRRARRAGPAKAAAPMVGGGLGGVAFGLSPFSAGGIGDVDKSLLGDTKDVVMTADTVDERPKPQQQRAPEYPSSARRKGVEGRVVLNLLIDEDGNVAKAKVVESQPPGVFDEAALAAARSWRFSPARYQGQAVKTWARQPVPFRLGGAR
mgnify:CR=1 FL=1